MCLNEIYSTAHTGKYLPDNFLFQNGLKQGNASSSLFFNFVSEYATRNVRESQVGLKLNGTYQLLAYADDVKSTGR
jgi:hypothetical protein